MITKGRNAKEPGAAAPALEDDPRWQIAQRAARSPALYRATQLRDMLLFIVRQTIVSPDEPIHESEIAHRVLGRRMDFNPLDDNIVRVQMAHLRKKLDLYFSTEGQNEETVITVALGSYRPVFSARSRLGPPAVPEGHADSAAREAEASREESAEAPASDGQRQEARPREKQRDRLLLPVAAVLAIVALAASCTGLWFRLHAVQQSLDAARQSLSPWKNEPAVATLWSNFFDTSRDTDVVLSDDSYLLIEQISKQSTPLFGYLNRTYLYQAQSGSASADTRFVQGLIATKGLGNTSEFKLAERILALDPLGKNLHLYSARQYMPALVKQDNLILIGGRVSNPWAELFENQLNFVENTRFENYGVTMVTNRAPAPGEPAVYMSTDSVGYCVVAFLPSSDQNGKVLLIEGTSAESTEAAGDFLSEEQFAAFRAKLHRDTLPYFEVLLKTSQVRGTPLTVTVESYRIVR